MRLEFQQDCSCRGPLTPSNLNEFKGCLLPTKSEWPYDSSADELCGIAEWLALAILEIELQLCFTVLIRHLVSMCGWPIYWLAVFSPTHKATDTLTQLTGWLVVCEWLSHLVSGWIVEWERLIECVSEWVVNFPTYLAICYAMNRLNLDRNFVHLLTVSNGRTRENSSAICCSPKETLNWPKRFRDNLHVNRTI